MYRGWWSPCSVSERRPLPVHGPSLYEVGPSLVLQYLSLDGLNPQLCQSGRHLLWPRLVIRPRHRRVHRLSIVILVVTLPAKFINIIIRNGLLLWNEYDKYLYGSDIQNLQGTTNVSYFSWAHKIIFISFQQNKNVFDKYMKIIKHLWLGLQFSFCNTPTISKTMLCRTFIYDDITLKFANRYEVGHLAIRQLAL